MQPVPVATRLPHPPQPSSPVTFRRVSSRSRGARPRTALNKKIISSSSQTTYRTKMRFPLIRGEFSYGLREVETTGPRAFREDDVSSPLTSLGVVIVERTWI